jgi:hypothetical protein
MADNESIGGVSVQITGDAGPLQASFVQVQRFSAEAGKQIAAAFTAGAAESTAAINRAAAAMEAAITRTGESGSQAFRKISSASHGAVTDIQAVSGTLRTLDGNQGIRAAERFLTMIPGLAPALQAAFPLIGAIAFAEVVARAVEHFQKLSSTANAAGEAIRRAFREIQNAARDSNDSLQVANDRLENEIAKIEKKPENGIKLALDEAIESADKLGASLDSDLGKLGKVIGEQKTGLAAQIFGQASTSDIEPEIRAFQDKVAKLTASSSIPRQESVGGVSIFAPEVLQGQKIAEQTRVNTQLTQLYTAEIQKLGHELQAALAAPSGGAVDNTRRVELLTAAIANLREQAKSVDLKAINGNLQGDKASAQAIAERARLQREADEQAREALHKRIEIFEQERRVWEQLQAARERGQEELNRAAQQLYDTNRRYNDEVERGNRLMRIGGVELANKSSEELSGQRPPTRGEVTREEPVNQGALQRLAAMNQQRLADEIKLQQAGIQTNNEIQSRIGNLQQELDAANRLNVPIETRLKLEKQILDAKIAQATANGQTDQTDKLAAAQNQIQQTLTQWKSLDLGNIAQSTTQAVITGVDGISSALGRAIVQGKNFGQAISQAGKQIAASILTSVIETGLKRILASLLGLIPGFQAVTGAQAGAAAQQKAIASASVLTAAGEAAAWGFESVMAALPFPVNVTVAPEVATAAFGQTSAFGGFAAGTDSAPGGWAVVGEKGPEIMYVPKGATVIPNHSIGGFESGTGDYASYSAASSSSLSVGEMHFHAHGVQNPQQFAQMAADHIPRVLKTRTSKLSPYSS